MTAAPPPDERPREDAGALDRLLAVLPRVTLVCGKGGVGKTTTAAALALRAAERAPAATAATSGVEVPRVLLLSTDPARTLGAALAGEHGDAALDAAPRALARQPALAAMQLDAGNARAAFLARWREVLVTIVDRGTYLDRADIEGLVDAALPGADEAMALLVLADLLDDARWTRLVVDTAPTGHTLRLLALPATFSALVALLDAMQEKHRFMVRALTRRYRADAADAFLDEMRTRVGALERALRDPARTAAVVVARPEPVVVAESERLVASLGGLAIRVGAIVVNAVPALPDESERAALAALGALAPGAVHVAVPAMARPPMGAEGIGEWGRLAREDVREQERPEAPGGPPRAQDATDPVSGRHRSTADRTGTAMGNAPVRGEGEGWRSAPGASASFQWGGAPLGASSFATLLRPLTIVGGKGGVGKTTVACALALVAGGAGTRTLLVSTDPAPSIADALGQPVGDDETPVAGAPNVVARQMDAAAAFARLRDAYQARIDAMFDGLMGGALDAAHDRRVLRDLLSLAPPGIDELYALASLGETLAERRFDVVIVDPAPTGHLLRLLEMPALALEWSHRLMRLMLKYKEIAGLGDAAAEVLAFAKRTRAVGELLRDPARAALVCVALDEPLVRHETARLVAAVGALGVGVSGVLWNRLRDTPLPLTLPGAPAQFAAPAATAPLVGPRALQDWVARWRPLDPSA